MIVEKPNKSLRLSIDPKPLNKYICREYFQIPTAADIISKLTAKNIFSVIDMKDGFGKLSLIKKVQIYVRLIHLLVDTSLIGYLLEFVVHQKFFREKILNCMETFVE